MFKRIISTLGVILFAFSMNAGAQGIRVQKLSTGNLMLNYSAQQVTSKIDIKGDEFWGGYWNGDVDKNVSSVGVKRIPETYDVAICYPAGSAEISGMTMEGIRFSFPSCQHITDVKIWMSTTLPSVPEDADILVQEVTELTDISNEDDPFIEVRFDKPYKSNLTKDLYIGYSFKVEGGNSDDERYPVFNYRGEDKPNALLLKFDGADGEWVDYNGNGFGILLMQVLMSGTFPDNAVTLQGDLGSFTLLSGSGITIPMVVGNAGLSAIDNMDVTVSMNGESEHFNISPEVPVSGIGTKYQFDLDVTLPLRFETGRYDITVSIDKVNGEKNAVDALSKGNMFLLSKAVARKSLVEEFTAMWCGYCPRGILGMEKLRDIYLEDVVIVAVHADDAMDCSKDYADILDGVPGFPSAHVDRTYLGVDPYFGLSNEFGIADLVDDCSKIMPIARVNAYADIDGDVLMAKSEVEFLYSGDASDFSVAYILTEDGMQDESWTQSNSYSGASMLLDIDPMFDTWVNAGNPATGIVYDDVAIAAKGITTGVEGSIPPEVTDGEKNTNTVEFDLSKYGIIQDRTKLNLAVVLLDRVTGKVINANYVPLSVDTAVSGVNTDNENVRETARYALDGRMISVPQKGVNIVKYSDGTVKKIFVK